MHTYCAALIQDLSSGTSSDLPAVVTKSMPAAEYGRRGSAGGDLERDARKYGCCSSFNGIFRCWHVASSSNCGRDTASMTLALLLLIAENAKFLVSKLISLQVRQTQHPQSLPTLSTNRETAKSLLSEPPQPFSHPRGVVQHASLRLLPHCIHEGLCDTSSGTGPVGQARAVPLFAGGCYARTISSVSASQRA
eukprot:3645931-Rhodomonas_salina.1